VLPALRAICFDLDNTLWHVDPVIVRAEERLMDWLAERYPRIPQRWSLDEMRAARMALVREQRHRAHDFTWIRTEAMARHAREVGYEEGMAAEAFDVFFRWRNEVEPFPDVVPALERLGRRYALATLSNGNADLARIGLDGHFSVSLAAGALGVAKPEPRAFTALAQALGCDAAQLLYVGDDPRLDVAGARAAGLRTAWLNRFAKPWPADLQPADLVARDLIELAAQLDEGSEAS
jgi:putative hydrolase of the HAD superfamily